ncbi:MAG: hypothetical protein ACYSX0_02145 [Planctomycetota bacterium]|jgi:tetratricopeptide (TPR) repeat protein
MRVRLVLPLLLAAAATLLAAPSDSKPVVLELKNGQRIPGRIEEEKCTDDILVIRHLRNKKRIEIPWADIKLEQARKIRVDLGFEVPEETAGLKIEGVSIKNRVGKVFRGRLTNGETAQKDGVYILKTSDGDLRIRVADVKEGPTPVALDALVVYTPLELYERRLAEKAPETAEDHFRLAEFCRRFGALLPAKQHYERVIELNDPKYPESRVARLLERVNKRLGSKEADDALKEIKKAIVFHKFKRATELMEAFKEKYAEDADLLKELADLEESWKEDRTEFFTGEVAKLVRDKVRDLIGRKVKEPELPLREAQRFAGGEPSDEKSATNQALVAIAEKLGIEPEEVLDFWQLRSRRTVYKAFYRDGTFIVVENLTDALAKAPKAGGGGKKGKKAPKPPKPHPQKTPDGWWNGKVKAKKYTELRDFLYAWWAEKSGMVELMEPKLETCSTCSGKGYTQRLHQTPQGATVAVDRCQNCHMAKGWRVVRFK